MAGEIYWCVGSIGCPGTTSNLRQRPDPGPVGSSWVGIFYQRGNLHPRTTQGNPHDRDRPFLGFGALWFAIWGYTDHGSI